MPAIMHLTYTGIRVTDLNRSIRFYTKVMGMRVTLRGTMRHGGKYVHLKSPRSAQVLELNWYPRTNKFYTPYRKGEELDHLAFWVKDVREAFEELTAKGAKVAVAPWQEGRYGLAYLKDPDGIWIELLGLMKKKPRRST